MASNTTLIINTGLKEFASAMLFPNSARRVRMYEPVPGRDAIHVSPKAPDAQWFGAVVEKNDHMPVTRSVANWRTTFNHVEAVGSKITIASGALVVEKRGRFGSIHMDPKTHDITLVYYGAAVRLAPAKFLAQPIAPHNLFS